MPLSPEAAELDSIFDTAGESLLRDQYGRPLLVPSEALAQAPLVNNARGKKRPDGKLPYTRASSMSNYMSDHSALETWRMRSLTKGLGEREDLAAMAAGLPPIISNKRSKETLTKAEVQQDRETNARLDEIAEEAMVYANRDYKANYGTAVHSFTDPGPSGDVPARMQADVESWFESTRGWQFHATETFVANDLYQAAGTFDHLVSIPWLPHLGRLVCDKKTGIFHPDQHAVQLAVYAYGQPYDVDRDRRVDWPDGIAPNREWGILSHIPLGLGRTQHYLINLQKGHCAALTAVAVRAYRGDKDLSQPFNPQNDLALHVGGLISQADSLATLQAIHAEYESVWRDEWTALGRQVLAGLEVAA